MIKEQVINTEIGNILRGYLYNADIRVEESGQLKEGGLTPDLVVRRASREPILIENKINNERELIKHVRPDSTAAGPIILCQASCWPVGT